MMRGLVLLSGFCLAAAGHKTTECVFDGGEAASDLMDASLFIWAATKRCGHSGSDVVKCEIDVTSAMRSMNGVIDVILRVVDKCGSLDTENKKVGFAASVLLKAVDKLAASSGKITEACAPPSGAAPAPAAPAAPALPCVPVPTAADPRGLSGCAVQAPRRLSNMPINTAMCVVDVKGIMKHLLGAIHALHHIKKKCKHEDKKCAHNILKVIAAFGGLGEYVSGAIGDCAVADFGGKFGESSNGNADGLEKLDLAVNPECASGISGLVKALAEVSQSAVDLSIASEHHPEHKGRHHAKVAQPPPVVPAAIIDIPVEFEVPQATVAPLSTRLFEDENDDKKKKNKASSTNFVLGAFLPVTALVSFVGGRIYAQRRGSAQTRQVATELE